MERTITGRLVNNEPSIQNYNPPEKTAALANIIHHWLQVCPGEGCIVCKAIEELKNAKCLSKVQL